MNKKNLIGVLLILFIAIGCAKTPAKYTTDVVTNTRTTAIGLDLSDTPTSVPLYPSVTPFTEQPDTGTGLLTATALPINLTSSLLVTKNITPTSTRTRIPTLTPTLTMIPSLTPTPTATDTPSLESELFLLQIVAPGPMSKVTSPIDLELHIASEYTGPTRIELIGEDGAKLFVKPFKTYPNLGYFTRVDEKIDFEIRGAAELARLQVSTFDEFGRLQAYSSAHLLLQAVGENEISATATIQDRLMLRYPGEKELVSGGNLPVIGEYNPADDLPVILELIDESGQVLGSRILQLNPGDGTYQQFTTNIPYQISKRTPVRLVIRQSDDRMDGLAYLFSRVLILTP